LEERNVRKVFFEHEHFIAVRRALPEEICPVITFGFYTGCRRGEILGLRWSQVDLSERVVRLEPGETKNDEARMIPLAPELFEMLVMQKEIRDRLFAECPWVFFRLGKCILDFRSVWEGACRAAGLVTTVGEKEKPMRLFHDLRRTGVRNLVRAGVSERIAMAISGHKTRTILDRYNIVSETDVKDAARKLGEYFAPKSTFPVEEHTNGTHAPRARVN
jgi:integrase